VASCGRLPTNSFFMCVSSLEPVACRRLREKKNPAGGVLCSDAGCGFYQLASEMAARISVKARNDKRFFRRSY